MTPEERAAAIIKHFPTLPTDLTPELSRVIASAIRKAVRAELKQALAIAKNNCQMPTMSSDLLYGKSLAYEEWKRHFEGRLSILGE